MNRCIQCYRCIRFYRDYAGGTDLEVLGAHDDVYFGRQEDGALENEFSGNLVEVCPTGVFTDKTLKSHYTRKWDLQTAPSVCVHCAVGCNTIPGERYGMLRRVRTRYNGEVNGYFLCDRGRYGYEFVNAPGRIRQPLARSLYPDGTPAAAHRPDGGRLRAPRRRSPAARQSGSARPAPPWRPTSRCARSWVRRTSSWACPTPRGVQPQAHGEDPQGGTGSRAPPLRQARQADAVLVLGEDAWNTAPILALNLRQASTNAPAAAAMKQKKLNAWDDAAVREAIRHEKGPFFIASVEETKLDEVARECHRLSPSDIAALGFAVAHEIDPSSPAPAGRLRGHPAGGQADCRGAEGRGASPRGQRCGARQRRRSSRRRRTSPAPSQKAGRDARISLVFPEANSLGAVLLAAGGLESAARALAARKGQGLVVAETDLFRGMTAKSARALLDSASHVICIDHTRNATTDAAEIVFPSCTYAESSGSMISSEGRAQRFFSVMPPVEPARSAWRWLDECAVAAGKETGGMEGHG